VIDRPEDIGQLPDGDPPLMPGVVDPETSAERSASSVFLRQRNFWVIAVVMALNFHANGAILTHAIPHALDLGFSAQRSALLLSVIAGVGVLGKIIFGWVSDHVDQRMALWLATACQAVAVVGFLLFEDYPRLLVAASVFGLGMGGMVPLWGALIGATFGRRAFGRVMGLMTPVMLPIQTTGVPLAGLIYDRQGSYATAFWLFIGLYLLSMVVLLALRSDRSTLLLPVEQAA
jgi:cyanate permease